MRALRHLQHRLAGERGVGVRLSVAVAEVDTVPAVEHIVARSSEEVVPTRVAKKLVVAGAAADDVVAAAAVQDVIAAEPAASRRSVAAEQLRIELVWRPRTIEPRARLRYRCRDQTCATR
jgi:hypothetical protein